MKFEFLYKLFLSLHVFLTLYKVNEEIYICEYMGSQPPLIRDIPRTSKGWDPSIVFIIISSVTIPVNPRRFSTTYYCHIYDIIVCSICTLFYDFSVSCLLSFV